PLQRKLEEFFEGWVFSWDFEKLMNLERVLDGINYIPLTSPTNQVIDHLIKKLKEQYPLITHHMVTFENQLVSSDILDNDLKPVWKKILLLTSPISTSSTSKKDEDELKKKKTSTFKFGKS